MNAIDSKTFQHLPALLTSEQVCSEIGISRTTLWRLIRAGEIVSMRIGRRCVRISREELEAFVSRSKVAQVKHLEAVTVKSR